MGTEMLQKHKLGNSRLKATALATHFRGRDNISHQGVRVQHIPGGAHHEEGQPPLHRPGSRVDPQLRHRRVRTRRHAGQRRRRQQLRRQLHLQHRRRRRWHSARYPRAVLPAAGAERQEGQAGLPREQRHRSVRFGAVVGRLRQQLLDRCGHLPQGRGRVQEVHRRFVDLLSVHLPGRRGSPRGHRVLRRRGQRLRRPDRRRLPERVSAGRRLR